ncbi:MAG: heme biosynthesis HemY N-terminal domain-containing protein [Tepidimonas sp.]|uniref:heme biosynthesis protein HemY n=1 Tax=Tepidimonas sp. TaxID=2002775 RepID=UPI00259D94C0|nr:heme biosynthesis HemY N-terminal domain-containing protein [Tepidimonas sp.]MDM7456971.1 heme biosynthesis HemY N-terminal domain-containing protein [Tepidimonas sp.]
MVKGVFGLLFVAALAVVAALLMGDNPATVSLFWPPWRVDVSFNLVLIVAVAGFVFGYGALRGIAVLRELPRRARRWRALQQERATVGLALQAWGHQLGGRFVRAQGAAREAIARLQTTDRDTVPYADALWVLAHLTAAESAHQLGQREQRDVWLAAATDAMHARSAPEAREGALLRAAEWAIEAQDPAEAARWLSALPQGAARRIQAVRLRLRLAQLRRDSRAALDMARLLAKHRAFSPDAVRSVLRGLWVEALRDARDEESLCALWRSLPGDERRDPARAMALLAHAQRLVAEGLMDAVGPVPAPVDEAIRTAWAGYDTLNGPDRLRAVALIEPWLVRLDTAWLPRLEEAQRRDPSDAGLQYLAAQAYRSRGLWGKAQTLLQQAVRGLDDRDLRRRGWCALAELAEQRGDQAAANNAWKQAAQA